LEPQYGLHGEEYQLSPGQAQAILELRLHRLTGLEQDKIVQEFKELLDKIADLIEILSDPDRLLQVIREELEAIREQYGDERRTEIMQNHSNLSLEDLITDETVVVTLSHAGYVKSQALDVYQAQRRGGRGKSATATKEEDFVDKLFVANTHDTLLCFTSAGKCYWLKVYMLPQGGRGSRGKPIVNLLPLEEGERVNAVLPVREYAEDQYVFMATRNGTVKKTALTNFSRPRTSGIIAVDLRGDDALVDVAITDGAADIVLATSAGKSIRFKEDQVRPMGRTAGGVRGVRLQEDQHVISLIILEAEGEILAVTENGYGKRTKIEDYPTHGRGGQGVIAMQTGDRNGALVGAVQVTDDAEVMLITDGGTLIRTAVNEISVLGRNTQGVRVIRVGDKERLIGIAPVVQLEGDESEETDGADTETGSSDGDNESAE
jgi:DNA gyrase subunit A